MGWIPHFTFSKRDTVTPLSCGWINARRHCRCSRRTRVLLLQYVYRTSTLVGSYRVAAYIATEWIKVALTSVLSSKRLDICPEYRVNIHFWQVTIKWWFVIAYHSVSSIGVVLSNARGSIMLPVWEYFVKSGTYCELLHTSSDWMLQ